jgi:hypothetical protein
MIQQCHSWGYNQRNAAQVTAEAPAHPCLLQRYSQQPSYENNQDAPLLMSGLENTVFIHNGILLSHKEERNLIIFR